MKKCVSCKKDIGILIDFGGAILVGSDGDFACSDSCKKKYYGEMDKLLSMSDKEFEKWLHN